jgi:hypothetical protein
MSCSSAYELAERSHEVFSAILIKILYPLPRRSPDHALGTPARPRAARVRSDPSASYENVRACSRLE